MLLRALKEDPRKKEEEKKIKFDTHIRNKHEITTDGRVAYKEFRICILKHT